MFRLQCAGIIGIVTWSQTSVIMLTKGCGYVAHIPAVAVSPITERFPPSKLLRASEEIAEITSRSSLSSSTVGSAPVGVRRNLSQTLPALFVHCCLAQLLK